MKKLRTWITSITQVLISIKSFRDSSLSWNMYHIGINEKVNWELISDGIAKLIISRASICNVQNGSCNAIYIHRYIYIHI